MIFIDEFYTFVKRKLIGLMFLEDIEAQRYYLEQYCTLDSEHQSYLHIMTVCSFYQVDPVWQLSLLFRLWLTAL